MFKLKMLIQWLIKVYAHIVLRHKKVYVVSGLRRSGNHACISWISASISGQPVAYQHKCHKVYISPNEQILHLNEVNFLDLFDYAFLLQRNRNYIKKAKVIIISLEDHVAVEGDMYFPKGATHVTVVRDVLTTIASRITYNLKRAANGIDRGDMHIDDKFFELYRRAESNELVWRYSSWKSNGDWRKQFLHSLGLACDLEVGMSLQGAGSSFHKNDNASALAMSDESRWKEVNWSDRVIDLLSQNVDLLKNDERSFFNKLG